MPQVLSHSSNPVVLTKEEQPFNLPLNINYQLNNLHNNLPLNLNRQLNLNRLLNLNRQHSNITITRHSTRLV